MKNRGFLFVFGLLLTMLLAMPAARAAEGMWPLSNLPTAALKGRFGFTPTAKWIRQVQLASVRLAGGCSGSFVSPHGLVLSNHHCAVGCLEGLSRPGQDLMARYFYAATRKEEPRCPAMEIEQLVSMRNVTATVNRATHGRSGAAFAAAMRAVSNRLESACVAGDARKWRCELVRLYHGGQDWMYKYRRYQDVRLVFVPSQSTAFFGGYPDNFNYPRYDYDISLLRVFVHGRPARTPEYFRLSARGPHADELVFTSGNPGATERDDTVAQLKSLRYPVFPLFLQLLSHQQGLLEAFSAESAHNAEIAAGTLFFVDNAIKSIDGQLAALNDARQFVRKVRAEKALRAKVAANVRLKRDYGGAWKAIAAAEKRNVATFIPYSLIVDGRFFDARLFNLAFSIVLGAHERTLPDAKRMSAYRAANLPLLEQQLFSAAPVHPSLNKLELVSTLTMMRDLLGNDAPICAAIFAHRSPREVALQAVGETRLGDVAARKALWKGGEQAVKASKDPMIVLARKVLPFYLKLYKQHEDEISAPIEANTAKIARLRFAIYGTRIAPDATFTERVSYGMVKGWLRDGKPVPPFTTVAGLYGRARDYDPLKLSPAWLAARDRLKPTTPMNFVSSNDIVGGNSGSPVIDRDGRLVGLIFDGNPPSLGGAFWYDDANNRAVAVDSAVILAALKHVYHANALVKELRTGN